MKILNDGLEVASLDAVRPHPRNPRQGDVGAISVSINENGFYGAIIAQRSTGYILAGNHRYQAAIAAGADRIPVQWVDVDDAHALRILLADNRTNDVASYDDAALAELLTELAEDGGLTGTGYDGDDLDQLLNDLAPKDDDGEEPYSWKAAAPIYTPRGTPPDVTDLYDRSRTEALLAEINELNDAHDLNPELVDLLRFAAERHTVFRYDRIADYYPHATAAEQRLIEASALVIIDYEQAIERGFVTLERELTETFEDDWPDA